MYMDQSLEIPKPERAGEADSKQTPCHGKNEDRMSERSIADNVRMQQESGEIDNDADASHNAAAAIGSGVSGLEMDNLPLKQVVPTNTEADGFKKFCSDKPHSEKAEGDDDALRLENSKTVDLVTSFRNESEQSDKYSKDFENRLEQLENNFSVEKPEIQMKPAVHTEDENKNQGLLAEGRHKLLAEYLNAVADVKESGSDSVRDKPDSVLTVAAESKLSKAGVAQQAPGEHQEKTDEESRHLMLSKDSQVPASQNVKLEMKRGEKKKEMEQKAAADGPKEKPLDKPISKHQEKKLREEKRKNKGRQSRTSKRPKHDTASRSHESASSSSTSLAQGCSEVDGNESDAEEDMDSNSEEENCPSCDSLKGSHGENTQTMIYKREPTSTGEKSSKDSDERKKVTSSDANVKGSSSDDGRGKVSSSSDKQPGKSNDNGSSVDDAKYGNSSSSTSGTNGQEKSDPPDSSKAKGNSHGSNATQKAEQSSQLDVHFHVGLSPEFHFNKEKQDIYVVFFSKQDRLKMNIVESQVSNTVVMLTGTQRFSAHDLTQQVEYKYALVNKEPPNEIFCEHSNLLSNYHNRCLSRQVILDYVKSRQTSRSSDQGDSEKLVGWHQYDGIARPSQKFFKWIKTKVWSIFKDNNSAWLEENSNMIQAIIPEGLCFHHCKAEETLNNFQHVCHCISQHFLDLDGNRFGKDQVDKVITRYILVEVDKIQKELGAREACPKKSGARLASALSIIHIARKYVLKLNENSISILCRALSLKPDYTARACGDFVELLLHFPTMMGEIKKSVVNFLNWDACRSTVHWLLAIPLVHFLNGLSKPFQILNHMKTLHNDTSGKWWGEGGIEQATHQSKSPPRTAEMCKDIKETVNQLVPLFEVDLLLPRTLLASMTFEDVVMFLPSDKFPTDAALANLYFFIKTCCDSDLVNVGSLIDIIAKQVEQKTVKKAIDADFEWEMSNAVELCGIALDLVTAACNRVRRPDLSYWIALTSLNAFLAAFKRMQYLFDQQESDHSKQASDHSKTAEILDTARNVIFKWLDRCFQSSMIDIGSTLLVLRYPEELQCMDDLMGIFEKFLTENQRKDWVESWKRHLRKRVNTMKLNVIEYFATHEKEFSEYKCPLIEETFAQSVFEIMDDCLKAHGMDSRNMESMHMEWFQLSANSSKMVKILSKLFHDKWPAQSDDDAVVLKHVLGWPAFVHFQKSFGKLLNKGVEQNALDSFQVIYTAAISLLETTLKDLVDGKIKIHILNILLETKYQKQLMAISDNLEDGFSGIQPVEGIKQSSLIATVLVWRKVELEDYQHQLRLLISFMNHCKDVESVDCTPLRSLSQEDQNEMRMWDLCEPRNLDTVEDRSAYRPSISRFHFSQEALSYLEKLETLRKSRLFIDMWQEYVNNYVLPEEQSDDDDSISCESDITKEEADVECYNDVPQEVEEEEHVDVPGADGDTSVYNTIVNDVMKFVWRPFMKKWTQFKLSLMDGGITVGRTESLFDRFQRDYDKIGAELELILGEAGRAKERLEQIELLAQVDATMKGAKVILKAKEEFKIEGDFSDLETLIDLSCKRTSALSSISKGLLASADMLKSITEDRSKCLDVFLENKILADWLKETLPLNELRTFIDIALIVATGEGAVQVEYIVCLDAAVKGYAPFIYQIKDDMSYEEFLQLCSEVWDVLQVDPKLPEKFTQTARNLDFLKQILESHGSVEGNAISKTKCINKSGVYSVGFHEEQLFKNLTDVISLEYKLERQDGGADDTTRCMDLQQLTDLHNKLMLIIGGDEEIKCEVEQFGEIFAGILRLGETYIKLCAAGCSLFHHWKAVFFCCPSKHNKVYMDFSSDGPTLKSSDKGVVGQIQDVCRYMESCLDEWLKHVEEQRDQFYHLNFFTTQQLMILQRELSKIRNNDDEDEDVIGQKVYALLSLVKKDCSYYDLCFSYMTAGQHLTAPETRDEEVLPSEQSCEDAAADDLSEEENSVRSAFIQAMGDIGFSRTLALRALDAGVDPSSPENGTMWCMENEDSDEMVSKCKESSLVREDSSVTLETPSDASSDQWIWPELQASLTSVTSGMLHDLVRGNDDLKTKLELLWKGFLGQTTESFTDCLSLKHLGLILKSLANDEDEKTFDRPMPTYLKTSQPNLIVCCKSDVLSVILSIYSFNEGVNLPLPGVDEVLLCSSETTAEDVELIFRRASVKNNKKIFCVVYADMLDYEVACQVEDQMLTFFPAVPMQGLRLVVICCREQEIRSNIVSALDRYRIHVPQFDHNELKTYLKKHFVVKSDGKLGLNSVPASHVDPEQCSIRQIQSYRSGVGKTLRVKRLEQALRKKLKLLRDEESLVTISMHSKTLDRSKVMKELLASEDSCHPRIFHLDVAPEVQEGVDHFLFSLFVLGSVTDEDGFVWRRRDRDLYVVECMPLMMKDSSGVRPVHRLVHQMFSFLPSVTCWSPQDSIDILLDHHEEVMLRHPECTIGKYDQLIDTKEFESEELQRPFQYLKQYANSQQVQRINRITAQGTPQECIQFLLRHCGVVDPSWSELHNFASFLNVQLKDCEQSCFCMDIFRDDLPGFLTFVVKFMIQMSKHNGGDRGNSMQLIRYFMEDFATRSLNISEESPGYTSHRHTMLAVGGGDEEEEEGVEDGNLLQAYSLKRRWEMSPHPYLFFNNDHQSFTFMGFVMDRHTQHLLDPQTKKIIEQQIMPQNLHQALYRNQVNLQEDFEKLPRHLKIEKLCSVMGQDLPYDPDESYELTGDNVKKILAIFMRFRCHIPVIIMGETGCGKTRLVKFMCDLWRAPGEEIENMILMKMHGGTTEEDIMNCLNRAIQVSVENRVNNAKFGTVLFFDEANTTEAIGLIKEIMCDHTCNGKPLPDTSGLHLIAACNPYRKHSDLMIERLEQAGLGYRVRADQTRDKLGYIPMRQLVYRVQALPQSMLPLVWDFGQLNDDVESLYIRQMVSRYLKESPELMAVPRLEITVSQILAESQIFMRSQQDECSFVSLRDVDRALKVMMWFYRNGKLLFKLMDREANKRREESANLVDEEFVPYKAPNRHTRSLILALGICYHACLQNRDQYRRYMSTYFHAPCSLDKGPETLLDEINLCQDVFLDNVGKLGDDIARNKALKENVFMMVICIELRIPLFLVGKPGSSKSLAKTIVGNAMLGKASVSQLFKEMKSVHMVSFQCSPLSTPEGIIGTFEQCAQLQKEKELDKHVAVVVLDEVGLAEDSPKMPLKTLHPLLEYGCEINGQVEEYSKVGFIGISNWALDPAKMNRGILVLREVPDEEELLDSAKGICSGDPAAKNLMSTLMKPLTLAYKELYTEMQKEFFGLRDFYSLIKMVYAFCKKSKKEPTWFELKHAILRNFDGLDVQYVCPLKVFEKHLPRYNKHVERLPDDPDCSSSALIQASLHGIGLESESRYLLILTENYVALGLLHQQLEGLKNAVTIFGSSFPRDQEYTQVCRNINRIKTCMETGRTVVLLNLENLYESLYDALNQYYMRFNNQRFVDLGLGTQRVKCKVHKDFRLIVVAEKTVVYEKFPIPLINRLEKHILSMETMLTEDQMKLVKKLQTWAENFCTVDRVKGQPEVGDVFIGYHADAAASVILQLWKQIIPQDIDKETSKKIMELAKSILLQCATPDSLIRLSKTDLSFDAEQLQNQYFIEQHHSDLADLIQQEIKNSSDTNDLVFMQITTHSLLLSRGDLPALSRVLDIHPSNIHSHSLQGFDTEQQFCSLLREVFRRSSHVESGSGVTDTERSSSVNPVSRLFLLQCDAGDANPELIACARYNIFNEYSQVVESEEGQQRIHVVFIIQLPRVPGGCFAGFQGGKWKCYHLDELLPATEYLPKLSTLKKLRISELFCRTIELEGQRGREGPPMLFSVEDGNEAKEDENEEETEEQRTMKEKLHEVDEDLLRFNVDRLILNCLHRAAALLKDSEKDRNQRKTENDSTDKSSDLQNRKIHRLSLLLKLLRECNSDDNEQADSLSLMSVIKRRLGRLLRDKETATQMAEQAGNWLTNEVSTIETTAKAGSFRRALLQTLESKVTPLLSGIIAYSDRNANLDLLEGQSSWQQKVWLKMLNEEEVTLFRYRDLNSPEHRAQTGLPEYQITNTGCDGRFFKCSFPFSWVIKEQIDLLLHQTRQSGGGGDAMKYLVDLLEQTDLGEVLTQSVSAETKSDMIEAYINDFSQMIYKSSRSAEAELKWVSDDLKRTMSVCGEATQLTDSTEASLLVCFVNLHLAFEVVHPRLLFFSELLRIWPDSIQFIASDKDINQPLDVKVLFLLLEHLVSEAKQLDTPQIQREDWLAKTDLFRPLIEQLLESIHVNADDLSQPQFFQQCCHMWNRVLTVQLFIKHVCIPRTAEASLIAKKCKRLFMVLGENANLKEIKYFQALESFLQSCNREAIEYYIGLGNCGHCGNSISDPVELPCSHTMCLKCAVELMQIDISVCPRQDCNRKFPRDLHLIPLSGKSTEVVAHDEFRRCLNSFFMEVIYSLCFLRNSPPSEEVVAKLMEYVTLGAKETFQEKADPSPVVRSFVLQVLLQSENKNIRNYLDDYFEKASTVLKSTSKEIAELCVLVVNCLEDYHRSVCSMKNTLPDQIKFVDGILRSTGPYPLRIEGTPSATALETFGKIRFVLNQTATWIHKTQILKEKDLQINEIGNLLQHLGRYLEASESKWPRVYLMRVICNNYGLEILKQLAAAPRFHWIMSPEGKEEMEGIKKPADRFVVYGDNYKRIRDLICRIMLGSTTEEMTTALNDLEKKDKHCGRLVLLAIYRNLTLDYHHLEENQRPSVETKKTLMELCKSNPYIKKQEDLPDQLIENRLPGSLLVVSPDQTTRQLALAELLTHFYIVMFTIRKRKLHSPFVSLIFTPAALQNSLFPTMPQDDLERLKAVIVQKEQVVTYQCPNGHPYVIGECGNPNFVRNCPACGVEIGGVGHVARPGNVRVDAIVDKTRSGHCLGPANLRSDDPTPERDLSPASTMIMRLMLHMSMYLASSTHTQDVCSLVTPAIPENMLEKYLHHHIKIDLRDIGKAVGRNEDDVMLLIHLLLHHMTSAKTTKSGPQSLPVLATKEQRQEWENIYDHTYITPVLQKMLNGPQINEIQQTIRDDDNLLGNSKLIRLLYEVDRPLTSGDGELVENTSHLWRYRAQISLENLNHQLNDNIPQNQNQNAILKLFLREYWRLRYLRYLPSIVKLNRLMKQHLIQQTTDREAAAKWTVKSDEFRNSFSGTHLFNEVIDLISDFEVVWKAIRQNLSSFVFARGLRLTEEQCGQSINEDTKINTFVPSSRGDGLRSLAVVSYLCDVQNQFMEEYSQLTGQSLETSVDVSEASSAQVIRLDEQRDILPVLLANCTYSLKAGEGTTIRYDFSALEKQIDERFIRGKSRLQPYQLDQLSMLDDVSYAKLFEQLRQRIHQEPLPSQIKAELDEMKKRYSDLNELSSDLDTALGYLAFIGGKPNMSVHHFMTTVLRMKPKLKSTKFQGICLKHFESLWLNVAFMKTRHALLFHQNPFESVEQIYKVELTKTMVEALTQSLHGKRDLDVLVLSLFECILFHLTIKHRNDPESTDICNEELGLILDAYIEQKASTSVDWMIPSDIKVKHCISTWKHLVKFRPTNTRH